MSTVFASPNGAAFNLLNYLFKPGISGGQTAFGGLAAGETIEFQGADSGGSDVGRIVLASPIDLTYDTVSNTTPVEPYIMEWQETFTVGAYVGGFLRFAPEITTSSPTYIPGVFVDFGVTTVGAAPGFWAYTFINCLHRMESGAGFNMGSALVVNIGVVNARETAGTSTAIGSTGMNMAAQTRAEVAGAVMRKTTGDTGITVNPSYSAVAGATADIGTTLGIRVGGNATVPFGGSGAGTLIRDAIIGLDFLNTTQTVGGVNVALRSAVTNGTNRFVFQNIGGADSDHGAGDIHFNDNAGPALGNTVAAPDVVINWNASALEFAFAANSDNLLFSNPSADRFLISASADSEININAVDGWSIGDQAGSNGNQFGNIVQGAFAPGIAGDATGILLTQSGSYTNGAFARGRVSAWVINGMSYASSAGSVANSDTLTVGGMVTSSPGTTITERQSINVIAGRSRFQSSMQFDPINPSALASGDTNNWGGLLTGTANNNMRHWARVSGNADNTSTITGIDSGSAQDGDTFKLTNIGAGTITLTHQDTGSDADNRIITPDGNNYSLTENKTIEVVWDEATDRWRILTPAPQASFGLSGVWQFDDTTTMADPGDGNFRNNNATVGSVTAIAVADETKPGTDAGNILSALASGDQLYIQNSEDANEFLIFDITSNTDNTGWHELGGTVNASGGNFTDGKEFIITMIFA